MIFKTLYRGQSYKRLKEDDYRKVPADWLLLLLLLRQSCPALCDPIDGSPPGSSVPGILQARILEWAAISFSSA